MTSDVKQGEDPGVILRVRQGLPVDDATGSRLGVVELVEMGDLAAVSAQRERTGTQGGAAVLVAEAFTGVEPDLPEQPAFRLSRLGYIKIDTGDLFDRDLYAASDQIAEVDGDGVRLTVGRDLLLAESWVL